MCSSMTIFPDIQYENNILEHSAIGPIAAVNEMVKLDFPLVHYIDSFDYSKRFKISKENQQLFDELSSTRKKIIFISPGSALEHKRWPATNFVEVMEAINRELDAFFVMTGMDKDVVLNQKLLESAKVRGVDLASKTSIYELIEFFRLGEVIIGNDGGAMHIASLAGLKAVSIMNGAKYEGINDPFHSGDLSVYPKTNEFSCQEYFYNGVCRHKECEAIFEKSCETITVARVIDKFKRRQNAITPQPRDFQ